MKVSIITPTYNSSKTIIDCIDSIINQTYSSIEHIICDGGSSDNTIEVINKTPNRIAKLISEKDNGIYDAMNKGILNSTGDIIGILNSDDFLAGPDIIEKIVSAFKQYGCDATYGNLDFVSSSDPGRIVRHWKSSKYKAGKFKSGWNPPHPTLYVRKEVYEKFGLFDITLNVSADFEMMLRLIEKHKIRVHFIDKTIVKMRYGGESTGSLRKIIRGNRNIIKAFRKNEIEVSRLYTVIRILPKLKEFIIRA
jgi:glycosyltransferase involved in cell wall biosynthesis